MNIKNKIKDFIKKNVFIRKIARKVYFWIKKIQYDMRTRKVKVNDKLIIFASFNGRAFCDSPKAIYNYLIQDEKYKDYHFIWAFIDKEKHQFLEENRNTTVIDIKSKQFIKTLAEAKYWIFNYKIQDSIFPRKNQVFVQCWHGTPLKRLGCDLAHFNNAMNTISEIRDRYHEEAAKFDYFISPSQFATEKFISTWDLKKIGKENIIIEEGYPRNDFLINHTEEDIERIKKTLNIDKINKKIILYAPTYRDNQHSTQIGYTYENKVDFDKLQKELSDEYIILFRAHWLVAQSFNFEKYKNFVIDVSNYDDINELYIVADMLITDYSSVFFDYANLKRPILFYMYDLKEYRDEIRGFYLDIKELPGNIIENEDDLAEEIRLLTSQFEYTEKYKKFNERFNYLDDGKASKRVVEKILKDAGKEEKI